MSCCCADETSGKVEPSSPDSTRRQDSGSSGDQVFVTSRSCTDIPALLVLIVALGVFGFLLSAAVKKGDIYRLINGYDDCANVCGRVSAKESDPQFACKGKDMTKLPYLKVDVGTNGVKTRTCVASCNSASNEYVVFLNRCIPKKAEEASSSVLKSLGLESFFREATGDVHIAKTEMLYLFLIALAISLVILICFRYLVQYVIYIVLAGAVVASVAGAAYLWLMWNNEKKAVASGAVHEDDASVRSFLMYAIIMTIVAAITVLVVLVMRKRIALVMQLFREAGKAVYAMPALLLQPIYTYVLVSLTVLVWVLCLLLIESSGDLYKNRKGHIHYRKDAILLAARWYNLFVFFVMCEFYLGCQHMVVAGGVSQWFFKRDKKNLSLPVLRSTGLLVRFHLGTVAFGALIIGFVRLVRAILATIQKQLKRYDNDCVRGVLWCCQCCLWCFECALKFLTRNAYIETAIYGCNFCTGGKKAFQALSNNILRVAAINSVGDFVLFLGKVLVVALTVTAGIYMIQKKEGLQHPWVPIALAGIFAFLVAHCFISVYEMVIDTIFICFCEDCAKNDGINRPYFMSRGLMEFVENSKKALRHLEEEQSVPT